MGITSLSHLGIVGIVIAVVLLMWKLKQRKLRGPSPMAAAAAASRMHSIPWTFLKAVALAALFSGAMLPMVRTDGFAPAIHMASTAALTLLAGLWLFRKTAR